MYLDAAGHTNKTENIISINRTTAACQLEVQSFQILINYQYILFRTGDFIVLCLLQIISLGTAICDVVMRITFPPLLFQIFIDDFIHIQCFICDALIKVCHCLEAETFDQAHHYGFIIFYFPVLEFTLYRFFGKGMLAGNHLLQCLAYLGTCLGAGYNIQPILFGCLCIRGHNFHLITTIQHLPQLGILAVYFRTDTLTS